jgi:hypothetical protein
MVAGLTVNPSMRVISCPFAMIPMAGGALDPGRPVRRSGNSVMALDTGDPSMDCLSILFLIHIERNRLSIHLLFHILLSMTIHAEKDGGDDPFCAIEVDLTMALPAELLLRLHDLLIRQPPGKERG